MSYENIRAAIKSELSALRVQQQKLEAIMSALDDNTPTTETSNGKKRGRKSAADKQAASDADVVKAIGLIEAAGKPGVKAIKLSYLLRGAGHQKVGKVALLGTDKVRMTGKGGASTYVYTG